MCVSDKLTGGL